MFYPLLFVVEQLTFCTKPVDVTCHFLSFARWCHDSIESGNCLPRLPRKERRATLSGKMVARVRAGVWDAWVCDYCGLTQLFGRAMIVSAAPGVFDFLKQSCSPSDLSGDGCHSLRAGPISPRRAASVAPRYFRRARSCRIRMARLPRISPFDPAPQHRHGDGLAHNECGSSAWSFAKQTPDGRWITATSSVLAAEDAVVPGHQCSFGF